jgi:hypothetical protein
MPFVLRMPAGNIAASADEHRLIYLGTGHAAAAA